MLQLHSHVSKPDELCKEQKIIEHIYVLCHCKFFWRKNILILAIRRFMNNTFWFQRNITCLISQILFPTLYFRRDIRLVLIETPKYKLRLSKQNYASWYLIICANNSLRCKGRLFSYLLNQYILRFQID